MGLNADAGLTVITWLNKKISDTGQVVGQWRDANQAADGTMQNLNSTTTDYVKIMEDAEKATKDLQTAQLDLFGSVTDVGKAEANMKKSVQENGKTLDANTEKGRANRTALDHLAGALIKNHDSFVKVNGEGLKSARVMDSNRAAFIRAAQAAGLSATKAKQLANDIGLIPSKKEVRLTADNARAKAQIAELKAKLAGIQDETVRINIIANQGRLNKVENQLARLGGNAVGGIKGAASGGNQTGLTWVGEEGPELLDLPVGSRVRTAGDSRRAASQSGGDGGTLVVPVYLEGKVIAKAVLPHFQTMNRSLYQNDSGRMFKG
jgi:hypothetical protein